MNVNASGPARMFTESPVVVNDGGLDEALKIYSPFVLDCWEIGCRPCDLIDVSRTPTLLVFKNGSLVYKQVGNYPQEELEHIILTVLHMR